MTPNGLEQLRAETAEADPFQPAPPTGGSSFLLGLLFGVLKGKLGYLNQRQKLISQNVVGEPRAAFLVLMS